MLIKMRLRQTGHLKQLKLTAAQYRELGEAMLRANKRRIGQGINAEGRPAKPLSRKYSAIKKRVRRVAAPKRDMKLTGATLKSYQIVRSYGGLIRAEPKGEVTRRRAFFAQRLEPMFGFTDYEEKAVLRKARSMFGRNTQFLWTAVNG